MLAAAVCDECDGGWLARYIVAGMLNLINATLTRTRDALNRS